MIYNLKKETKAKRSLKPKEVDHPELLRGHWANNCKDENKYNTKDEFYTQPDNVKSVFEEYIDTTALKDKILWLPCDTEESEFYKWLVSHKDEYGYKELIMTSDDMFTHKDILAKADFVIDNVPFSRAYDIIDMFKEEIMTGHDFKFFIFYNMNSLATTMKHADGIKDLTVHRTNVYKFDTPHDKPTLRMGSLCYITNMKIKSSLKPLGLTSKMMTCEDYSDFVYGTTRGNRYPVFDFLREIPIDYKGWFLAPTTCVLYDYSECFEVEYSSVDRSTRYSDDYGRYVRFKARWKPQHLDHLIDKRNKK